MEFKKNLKNLYNNVTNSIKAKRYFGLLPGNLPVSATNWSGNDFLNAYQISLYTNRAVSKRAEKVSEIEFVLKKPDGTVIENDPLLDILNKPNVALTGMEFWGVYQKHYDLVGEAYILIESRGEIFEGKSITGLHILNPTAMKPFFDGHGNPTKYEYKTTEATIPYKPEEILYIKNPNPSNPLRGMSLLRSGINAIQTETQIGTYHSRVLDNGGKVEGVFKFKTDRLTETQLSELKTNYQKQYASAKKAGLPLFLGGDADYVRTGLTPDELSFLEAKKSTFEDIAMLTGVPKTLLGSFLDIKFDNADASLAIFLRETIKPLLKTLTVALDTRFYPEKDKTLTFVDPTPENVDQELKKIESGMKNYYMTINEARERQNLDPIANGDDILVPFNVMPLGTEKESNDNKSIGCDCHKKSEIPHPLKDADVREIYGRMQIKRMDAREKKFVSVLDKYFDSQRDRIVDALDASNTRVFRKKNLIDEVLTLELEVTLGKEVFIPILTGLLEQAGIDAMELAGSDFEFNLTGDIAGWIDNRASFFLTSINETTFKQLQSQFEQSLADGESRAQLINRIKDTYGNISSKRAATIARTEVHNATQQGTINGYEQAGLKIKIWVTVGDAHVRESHMMTDGEERPLNTPFSNGLMYPGDTNGSAEETINCRCVI